MNFISTFEELDKLYESTSAEKEDVNSKDTAEVEEACMKETLTEASDEEEIEIVDDEVSEKDLSTEEASVKEPVEDEENEPKQLILECDKCGALVIKVEADVVVDEESGLADVEESCAFCEETAGYKIIGVVTPYEAAEVNDEELEEVLDFNVPVNITANDNNVAVGGIN